MYKYARATSREWILSRTARHPVLGAALRELVALKVPTSHGTTLGFSVANTITTNNPKTMSAKSTIAIALTALAAGAAIGLLLAPASGADTRKKLMKKGSALRDRLADMVEEGSELIDKLKGDAEDLADKAKSTANAAKERVKDAASDMASQARSTANAGGYSKS